MSDGKEGSVSNPLNEVKDRKYGIGITRFFKVLGKDETRPKPSLNPIEHMKFVNKSPGKPRKRMPVSQAKRRKSASSGVSLPVKNKPSPVEESDGKAGEEAVALPRRLIKPKNVGDCRKVPTCKRRLRKRGGKSSEDVSKESSDPYSVDNSDDSDLIISYSAFLKDTLLKKKPSDQIGESNDCKNQKLKSALPQSQAAITTYFSVASPMQNGSSFSSDLKRKKKKTVLNKRTKSRSKRSSELCSNSEGIDDDGDSGTSKRLPRKSLRVSTSIDDINGGCQSNLRRSSRIRKPVLEHLPVEYFDEESVQSNDGLAKEKYACKVSVVNEEDGKPSIKLRLTRISDKCKKSKAIVEKAQKLIRKSKRRAAMNPALKLEQICEENVEVEKSTEEEDVVFIENEVASPSYPIASLFLKTDKSNRCMPKLDEETLERRRQFLRSGIPESLQQQIANASEDDSCPEFLFPTIGHITQSDCSDQSTDFLNTENYERLHLLDDSPLPHLTPIWQLGVVTCNRRPLSASDDDRSNILFKQSLTKLSVDQLPRVLEEVQEKNPSLNVTSIYNSYVSRKDPSYLNELHAMKKRPLSSVSVAEDRGLASGFKRRKTNRNGVEQIVAKIKQKSIQSSGDEAECVNVLLSNYKTSESSPDLWTNTFQPEFSISIVSNESSIKELKSFLGRWSGGEKHFLSYDVENLDSSNSCGSNSNECNAALVIGPTGCGKTVAVYTIARELGFKVLEINASSKRTSKLIMSQLQEATQSRRVKEATIQSAFLVQTESTASKQEGATMSLILFEDVDIVFLEDEGFWSAVNEFISTTKIPVVLTTSDIKFRDKGYIKGDYETFILNAPDLNSQVVHMQILCLTNNWQISYNDIYKLVSYNKNNFRRSVLLLQYLCNSEMDYREMQTRTGSDREDAIRKYSNANSSLEYDSSAFHRDVLFTCYKYLLLSKYQNFLSLDVQSSNGDVSSRTSECCTEESSKAQSDLSSLVRKLDDLCVIDCLSGIQRTPTDLRATIFDGIEDKERDLDDDWFERKLTLNLQDAILSFPCRTSNCENYQNGSMNFSRQDKLGDVLCQSILSVQRDIMCSKKYRELQETVCSHILHSGHGQIARALSLDFLPSLRAICRSEKDKQATSNKRSGSFLHYLSSISFYLEPFTISELCKNLGPDCSA